MTDVALADSLIEPGSLVTYKWQDAAATYPPDSPWFSLSRFGGGSHKTLYVAETSEGAVAEFLRRHPELIDFQDDLRIVLYELRLQVDGGCVDLRDPRIVATMGIEPDRLTSSDRDEDARYAECRRVAETSVQADASGIFYPSAATVWVAWNLVLLGDSGPRRWTCESYHAVARPRLADVDIRALPRM